MKIHIQNFSKKRVRFGKNKLDLRQIFLWIGLSFIGLFLFSVLAMGVTVAIMSAGLPDVHDIDKMVTQPTTLYDREGNKLFITSGGANREYVNYDEISPNLINATIAIEDNSFWEHSGFSPRGIVRAVVNDVVNPNGQRQGGSTISQQYVKRAFLTPERSLTRKIKELILAVQLEQAFDKKKIIELYVNAIPYGNNADGIEKASQIYFNKHAKDLDIAESSILASIPKDPTYYNPYRKYKFSSLTKEFTAEELAMHPINSAEDLQDDDFLQGIIGKSIQIGNKSIYIQGRSDLILSSMVKYNYITPEEKQKAWEEIQKITFNDYHSIFKAQHFVYYVIDQLEAKYGKELVAQGGLQVYTTLDPKLEEIAEKVVKEGALANEKKFNAKNASLVAMDPKKGEILAMVGSRDYKDVSVDGNENVALNYLQPGSSFKPFAYAQAFYNRYTPASIVFDTPMQLGSKPPKNFDGTFRGPMSMRSALAQSRNIPAIKAYYAAGQQKPIIELAERMGIHFAELKDNPEHQYSYTLALGSAGVTLLDMVTAYSVFANGGTHHDPVSILKVEDAKGNLLPDWQVSAGEPVLDPQVAYLITSILSDLTVRLSPNMTVPNQINAAKTGTSNRVDDVTGVYYPHDLWTMGYTTTLVAGVWTGNNVDKRDGKISTSADGTNVAAPIWKNFMTEALKGKPSEEFPVPEGIKQVAVATASGKLPGPLTPADQIKTEVFASFSVPTEIDNSYDLIDIDMLCGKLANEFTPEGMKKKVAYLNQPDLADMEGWKKGVEDWLQKNAGKSENENASLIIGAPPTESCPERTAQNYAERPVITIMTPTTGTSVAAGSHVKLEVQTSSTLPITKVEYFLDETFKYSTVTAPYQGDVRFPVGEENGIHHKITAKVYNKLGFTGENSVDVITAQPSTIIMNSLPEATIPTNTVPSISPTVITNSQEVLQ